MAALERPTRTEMIYAFNFTGRIGRAEWWAITLITQITWFVGALFIGTEKSALILFGILMIVAAFWVGIAANVKRFHDRGKSGAWVLIALIPIIGTIWILVELGCTPHNETMNVYGVLNSGSVRQPALAV